MANSGIGFQSLRLFFVEVWVCAGFRAHFLQCSGTACTCTTRATALPDKLCEALLLGSLQEKLAAKLPQQRLGFEVSIVTFSRETQLQPN